MYVYFNDMSSTIGQFDCEFSDGVKIEYFSINDIIIISYSYHYEE